MIPSDDRWILEKLKAASRPLLQREIPVLWVPHRRTRAAIRRLLVTGRIARADVAPPGASQPLFRYEVTALGLTALKGESDA